MFKKTMVKFLESTSGKCVHVTVIGAIKIPYVIENLEYEINDLSLNFGENECEYYGFQIYWEIIKDIHIHEGLVRLKLEDQGLITYLEMISAE